MARDDDLFKGLSSDRLQRINQLVQRSIDGGQITGAITMVFRAGGARHHDSRSMTHTSGLESGGPGTRPGARLAPRSSASDLAAYIPTLGAVPLDFQPGTQWQYSALAGVETLGRIVDVATVE